MQNQAPQAPRNGKYRLWLDALGLLTLVTEAGSLLKLVVGAQGSVDFLNGNTRGRNATDFQFDRESSEQVASGEASFIGGGKNNTASGTNSFIAGGTSNITIDDSCFISGINNSVGGAGSSASGIGNLIDGDTSHAVGYYNVVYGQFSYAEGKHAKAYLNGQHAKSSGYIESLGDNQYTNILLNVVTTDATPTPMLNDGSNGLYIEGGKMNSIRIMVVAKSQDNSQGAAYEFKGLIRKNDLPNTISIIGSIQKTVVAESVTVWDANVTTNTTNGTLTITVTGENSKTIRWAAFVEMLELQ